MEIIDDASDAPAGAADAPSPAGRDSLVAAFCRRIAAWRARARSRRLLAQFDERMLRDIGIDRARVWLETGKWFWQP